MNTVLTIQSHVAYGHVGNRVAAFILERLGIEAWVVNTVEYSNHTGYDRWTGHMLAPGQVADIIGGIRAQGRFAECDAVLSGYIGDPAIAPIVYETVYKVKEANPDALYVCDPVMGDDVRGYYVRPELPPYFRDHLLKLADIITPNLFELQALTGKQATDLEGTLALCEHARAFGPAYVLVTSYKRPDAPTDQIEMLLDSADGSWIVGTPRIVLDPPPGGAGDATTALLLANLLRTGDAPEALGKTAAGVAAILEATKHSKRPELNLIGAQDDLADPPATYLVRRVR